MSESQDGIEIVGSRFRLVTFTERHINDAYLGWLNDKSLLRYSRNRLRTHTRESCAEFLSSFPGSGNFFWAVESIETAELVGTMSTYVDGSNGTADIGILVGGATGGKGCGTEAWGLALKHGFESLGLRKVTGGTTANNLGMIRIFEKWGMVREGVQRKQELLDDGEVDVFLFGLLSEEWESNGGTIRSDA